MEQKGHIAKVDEPTDWVSSAVYVKKRNGQLRVCLDPRELNKHVKIPKLCLPTIDDVTSRLAKAQVFVVLDTKDGFLQVKLDEDSSKLTTFHTPFARYEWLRMHFGICSAPEEFQRHVNETMEGLEEVTAIAGDLLVTGAGNTHEEALPDHDRNLIALLQRYRKRNFKLNKDKFVFKQQKLKYCGHILTSEGILPDPTKVEAITQMPRPRSKTEVRRLLGMISYLGKFLPQPSDVSEPLRNLTKEYQE